MTRDRMFWTDADGSGRSRPLPKSSPDCFFCAKEYHQNIGMQTHTINVVKGVLATDVDLSWKMHAMKEIGDNNMAEIQVCRACVDRIVGSFALIKKGINSLGEEE